MEKHRWRHFLTACLLHVNSRNHFGSGRNHIAWWEL